jgi:hypothetical protein
MSRFALVSSALLLFVSQPAVAQTELPLAPAAPSGAQPAAPAHAGPDPYPYPYPHPHLYPQPPPKTLPYRDDETIPPGYRVEESTRGGLVIAGAITLGVFYGLPLYAVAAGGFEGDSAYMALPVVGPLILAQNRKCDGGDHECRDRGDDVMFTLVAIGQTTGAVLLAAGMLAKKKQLVFTEPSLRVTPSPIGARGAGLTAVGTF